MRGLIFAVLAAALSVPALAQQQGMPAGVQQQPAAASATQGGGHYDRQILQQAQEKLQKNDKYKSVRASVDDGIITLTGQVNTYMDKVNAQKDVRKIDHASGVRNQLQVTSTVPDSELERKLSDKLRYDRVGQGIVFNNLGLKVQNGVVTVSGQVIDYPSEASALAIVQEQPGVKDVIDDIQVLPTSNVDDDLRISLARAIYSQPGLQKYASDPQAPIRIVVKNGHVELDGVVDSQMDRQIAETQARSVPGVFSVKDNLVVGNQQSAQAK